VTEYVKNAARTKKHLVSCSKAPSYIKVKTPTLLSAASEAASEPSTSSVVLRFKLAEVAISVLHMPPTSQAMERTFSACSVVRTACQKKEINSRKIWQFQK
jgi:hypothetical protein